MHRATRQRRRPNGPDPGRRRRRHRDHCRRLCRARRLLSTGEQRAYKRLHVHACAAVARPDAAAVAAAMPEPRARVAHDSSHPVCRAGAGRSAVAAPPQRSMLAGCRGHRAARNGRNGRWAVAVAAGAGFAADGSVGGLRGVHAARSAAIAAATRPPREHQWRCSCGHDLSETRLMPREHPAPVVRLWAGRGRAGGGPRSRRGQPERRPCLSRAARGAFPSHRVFVGFFVVFACE